MAIVLNLPQRAARLWADPVARAKIIAMHARDESLLDMVSALGLEDVMEADGLRDVIEGLSSDEVQVIRDAFIAEARGTEGHGAHFPVDCRVDDLTGGVAIVAVDAASGAIGPIARINPLVLS